MKKYTLLAVFIFFFFTSISATASCRLDITIKGLGNKEVLFALEYGYKQIILDTIKLNSESKGFYESKNRLSGGIYIIILPNQKYFELLINDEQFFSISTDTLNYITNLVVEGSDETDLFHQYQLLVNHYETISKLKASFTEKDSIIICKEKIKEFKANVINKYPQSFIAAYFKMQNEPQLPESLIYEHNEPSKNFFKQNYLYTRKHYFDNINFNDIRLLHTTLISEKLSFYFNHFLNQNADTLCQMMDTVIAMAKVKDESYKFVLNFLNFNYRMPKNSEQEKVLVYLADNYYLNGKAPWADQRFLKLFQQKVDAIRTTLIGNKATDLEFQTIDDQPISIYSIKSKYLVLFFWSPDCAICKSEAPKLFDLYKKTKSSGLEVLAIYTHADKGIWNTYLSETGMDWINVYDPHLKTNFTKVYNVISTPKILLIDKDKNIIASDINVYQLSNLINK